MNAVRSATSVLVAASALLLSQPASADVTPICTPASLAVPGLPAADRLACARRLLDDPSSSTLVSTDALYDAMTALWYRSITSPADDDVAALHLFVRTLEARHAMRPNERRFVVQILLMNGQLAEAGEAKQKLASTRSRVLPVLDASRAPADASMARYWTWDTVQNVMHEHEVDLAHGAHLVVISSPGCHFCNDLASALPNDASLGRAFRDHAIWITRPDAAFDLAEMKRWDTRHPQTPLVTVFDMSNWPHETAEWSTPVFFFVQDGKVAKTVKGFAPSRVPDLRAGFRSIGVTTVD